VRRINFRGSDSNIDGSAIVQRFEQNLTLAAGDAQCPSDQISEGFIRLGSDPAFFQKFVHTFDYVRVNHTKSFTLGVGSIEVK